MRGRRAICARRRSGAGLGCSLAAWALLAGLPLACTDRRLGGAAPRAERDAASWHVAALGNLQIGRPPTPAEVQLATFLFGVEPERPLGLITPGGLCERGGRLVVCDLALAALLELAEPSAGLRDVRFAAAPSRPVLIRAAPDGGLLCVDAAAAAVIRYDGQNREQARYALRDSPFRPSGVLQVGQEVWVGNAAGHRIEVFDAAGGGHLRSIGGPGRGPLQFGLPLAMAQTPDGRVLVVDMLGCRVQLLSAAGEFLGQLGGPGDRVGRFGRPKDVAVGPDGMVFVLDAASQRIHVFTADGSPLLAFGQGGVVGNLALPAALAVVARDDLNRDRIPADFAADYFVLVAEQLREPGLRVFAWRSAGPRAEEQAAEAPPRYNEAGTSNPHWAADGCRECHAGEGERIEPIPAEQVDRLCLSCHDGVRAGRDAHPIGRPVTGENLRLPEGWPAVDGRLGCLTCHDIARHCDAEAIRPRTNPLLLRGTVAGDAAMFCTSCHTQQQPLRLNPHQAPQLAAGQWHASCDVCHAEPLAWSPAGQRRGEPALRAEADVLCLSCHVRHWDYFPEGHLGQVVPDESSLASAAAQRWSRPAELPLVDGRIACVTCHNPHAPGLFAADSPLGLVSQAETDRGASLRLARPELCQACHLR